MTLRERVARLIDRELRDIVQPNELIWTKPGGPSVLANCTADAIIPVILSEAAKVAREKGNQWHKEWRAGHKSSSHIEGKSDGADEIASAIERLS